MRVCRTKNSKGESVKWSVIESSWEPSAFAGGLAEFESSVIGPIPGMELRAVSPHPDPLPQGEGKASFAQWKSNPSELFSQQRMVHPLPKGEGRGEGKGNATPRHAKVFALACGDYPKGHRALSHS